jgi:PBP1b-binding outer membrane lipoprotein LpoB
MLKIDQTAQQQRKCTDTGILWEKTMTTLKTVILLIISAALLCACSGDNEKNDETGKIESMTKEIGQEAVRVIKTPIEKAQAIADKEEKRANEMDASNNQ